MQNEYIHSHTKSPLTSYPYRLPPCRASEPSHQGGKRAPSGVAESSQIFSASYRCSNTFKNWQNS
ncbi:hypothetical protein BDR06DRAFT_964824 [Suillus hirtellus]|nr:hypothetical protein BDR06DRAFT_964824 [Suillus hirtellus]